MAIEIEYCEQWNYRPEADRVSAEIEKITGHKVILVDYQPTSEEMIIDFSKKIKLRLPSNIKLHSLKLQETETSFAEWHASDQ